MAEKSFFKERTKAEIKRLDIRPVLRVKGLVEMINSLSPEEALQIRTWIIPGKFYAGSGSGKRASKKYWSHGDFIHLGIPSTKEECLQCPDIPLAIRQRALQGLENMREEEITCIGYSTRVNWGDRTKRIFPLTSMLEGARIFAYADLFAGGIGVDLRYTNAQRVRREGATVPVSVPSRTKKGSRYKFNLSHVPLVRSDFNLFSVLQLKPGALLDESTGDIFTGQTGQEIYDFRYNPLEDVEGSNLVRFYPQHVAAYLGIVKDTWSKHNLVPIEMNPFALPSKEQATFYKRLRNNVLVFDSSLKSKDGLRKLSLSETCILLARNIGFLGADRTAYWDPERDGKLKDYDWNPTT